MKVARDELKATLGDTSRSTTYLIAKYKTNHAHTTLKHELQKIVSTILLCDVTAPNSTGANNLNKKMELANNQPKRFVRPNARFSVPHAPQPVPEAGWKPGQPRAHRDKDGLKWMVVDFKPA